MIERRRRTLTRVGAAALALGVLAFVGSGPSGAPSGVTALRQGSSLLAASDAVVAPRLDCAALAPIGTAARPGVPDFTAIPGAPTRVTSATVIAAGASSPEYCDVKGYVAPQVQFELKLPTKTWQGRYLQSGCGGFCGAVIPLQCLLTHDVPLNVEAWSAMKASVCETYLWNSSKQDLKGPSRSGRKRSRITGAISRVPGAAKSSSSMV